MAKNSFAALGNLGVIAVSIVAVILGAVVGMIVLNALAPLFFTNFFGFLANMTAIANISGYPMASAILKITIIIVSIVGPLGFLGLAIGVMVIKSRGQGT